jgi:hypothetical protein
MYYKSPGLDQYRHVFAVKERLSSAQEWWQRKSTCESVHGPRGSQVLDHIPRIRD